jgi:sugar transferase (PEP-CTERM/EpsH1 system associated)
MIRHLHDSGHTVVVASIARSDAEAKAGEGLSAHCTRYLMGRIGPNEALARMLATVPTPTPASMGYFLVPRLRADVRRLLESESWDLVIVHCSSVAPYVADFTGAAKHMDFGDMDSEKWLDYSKERPFPLSVGYWLEGAKLRRAEAELARRFDTCSCTTPREVETLLGRGLVTEAECIPNGVNSEYFSPDGDDYDPNAIVFVGRLDYFPNIQGVVRFCRDVFPAIRAARPSAALTLVGAAPVAEVRRLAALPGVTVTGTVDDVRPYARRAAVNVAPLTIARGTQNKILESMAMGVPVVSTRVAAAGVQAVPGEHIAVAELGPEFATQVLRLMENPAERRRFSEAARARVLSHHTWPSSMRVLDRAIERCRSAYLERGGNGRASA